MTAAIVLSGVAILTVAVWAMVRRSRRARPGPENNWQNEDYMAREAEGTWAEGSLDPKSEPSSVFGKVGGQTK